MIRSMAISKTEARAYLQSEKGLNEHHDININYDISLKTPTIIKSRTSEEEIIRVEYSFSIVYTNPSLGYLRYEGEVDCDKTVDKIEDVTNEMRTEIANTVMLRILPMALLSSQSMGLPPAVPIPLPRNQEQHESKEQGIYQ